MPRLPALMLALILALILPCTLAAQDKPAIVDDVVTGHILPRYAILAQSSAALAEAAQTDCMAPNLHEGYASAFDAWVAVSHLRFGPSETENRAFALAFWPDARGATPKTLARMIGDSDPVVSSADGYADVSIAGRGFYALEFLLYDDRINTMGDTAYRCRLMQAITADIARLTSAMFDGWESVYATQMREPGENSPYRTTDEAAQELFKALSTGLEFTADTRLGRPMGTFERPSPSRAEAWRSGRSLRHVTLSLQSLNDLAGRLAAGHPALADDLRAQFAISLDRASNLDDPIFAGVTTPQGRLHVEALQQTIADIRDTVNMQLGPTLGVAAGFNALDGD
tara:strand:- start:60655 stop:61677 length:1023 start_codon:yes stop_codon:yes gene_type:complete